MTVRSVGVLQGSWRRQPPTPAPPHQGEGKQAEISQHDLPRCARANAGLMRDCLDQDMIEYATGKLLAPAPPHEGERN